MQQYLLDPFFPQPRDLEDIMTDVGKDDSRDYQTNLRSTSSSPEPPFSYPDPSAELTKAPYYGI
jgi:hypothetical protein